MKFLFYMKAFHEIEVPFYFHLMQIFFGAFKFVILYFSLR